MECKCVALQGSTPGLFNESVSPTDGSFLAVDGGDTFAIGVLADTRGLVGWGRAFYSELPDNGRIELPEQCKAVSCGTNHVLALTDSGRVMAWGWNKFGQVATTMEKEVVQVPIVVEFPLESVRIIEVAAGGMHSLVVDSNGRVWAWGCNTFGQLGVGSDVPMLHTPTLVVLPSDVRAQHVAAGFAHSAMISTKGEMWSFGWGLYNQLGHGSTQNEHQPIRVDALQGLDSDIVQVACGNWHTAALTQSGDLYTWGWGKDGQLGHGASIAMQVLPRVVNVSARPGSSDEAQDVAAIACGNGFTFALCRDGSVQYWGPTPTVHDELASRWLPQDRRVQKVAAGCSQVLLLLEPKN